MAYVEMVPHSPVRPETSVVFELPTTIETVPYKSTCIRHAKGRRSADEYGAMVASKMFDGLAKIHDGIFAASSFTTCI